MDTDSRLNASFHVRLFLWILGILSLFLLCFVAFQYRREKTFRIEDLNYRLQLLNVRIGDAILDGLVPDSVMRTVTADYPGLRVTLIEPDGSVVYDSYAVGSVLQMPNHLDREEVAAALAAGSGYTLRRRSESLSGEPFFYSATHYGDIVVRTAMPYAPTLRELLKVDRHFIWVMALGALAVSAGGYFVARGMGRSIERLKRFAAEAENGAFSDSVPEFPDNELGEVSRRIVALYRQLSDAKDALKNEHMLLLEQENEQARMKRQLTQNINHELKTPVSSVQGYLETIINNPDMDDATRRLFLERCYAQTIRLADLLKDIATLTRMDEGGGIIERSSVDLAEIITAVLQDTAVTAEARGIDIVCDTPSRMSVNGNASLLYSVFRNLADNACAYSGCTRITIAARGIDGGYDFTFADNGCGVPAEHLPHLFERFYRVDNGRSRKSGGTGLGLAIVKNAILFHGGTITADNSPEGGLVLRFFLSAI